VEVWGAEAPAEGDVQRIEIGAGRSRRVPAVALAAVAVLLVAGVVLGGGDDDPSGAPQEDSEASTTVERPSPSTTRPRPTTTSSTSTTVVLGPILPEPAGAGLLLAGESGGTWRWTWLDLDTGLRRGVELRADDAYGAIPVRGGVVLPRGGAAFFQPLPEGPLAELGSADQVIAAGLPDAVWLLRSGTNSGLPAESGTSARLVGLDGSVRATVAVPQLSYAFGATSQGLVFTAGGRAYLARPDGVQQLAVGEVLSVADPYVVLYTCDEDAVCAPEVLDTGTGRRHSLPPIPSPYQYGTSAFVSSSGEVAVASYQQQPSLTIYDASGRTIGTSVDFFLSGEVRWLPGHAGLVTALHPGVSLIRSDGAGGLTWDRIEGVADVLADLVFVIPR
jgi:hypothetical protein